jgi:hypothetical protein
VHHAFTVVIWVVCIVGIVVAFIALARTGKTWQDFGKRGLVMDRDQQRAPPPGSAAHLEERDAEIRELLEARNTRRRRRGQPMDDIDRELARMTAPPIDPDLRAEIIQLVKARNVRRLRAGKPPLDVDAEVEREIDRLRGL